MTNEGGILNEKAAAYIVSNYWNKSGYYMSDIKFLNENGDLRIKKEIEDIFTFRDQLLE